jgi:hypothetical protein
MGAPCTPEAALFKKKNIRQQVALRNATAVAAALSKYDADSDGAMDQSEQSKLRGALNFKR